MNFSFEPPAFFGLSFEFEESGEPETDGALTVVVGIAPVTGETRFAAGTIGVFNGSVLGLDFSRGGGVTGEGIALT